MSKSEVKKDLGRVLTKKSQKNLRNIPKLLETRPKIALVYWVPHKRGARLVSRKKFRIYRSPEDFGIAAKRGVSNIRVFGSVARA